jgi:hypothetical protein
MIDNNDLEEYQSGKYKGQLIFNYSSKKRLKIFEKMIIKDIAKIIHDYDQSFITIKYKHYPSNCSYMYFIINHSINLKFVEYNIDFIYTLVDKNDILILQQYSDLLVPYCDPYEHSINDFNMLIFFNEYISYFMNDDYQFNNIALSCQSCSYDKFHNCFKFVYFRESGERITYYRISSHSKIKKIINVINNIISATRFMFKLC